MGKVQVSLKSWFKKAMTVSETEAAKWKAASNFFYPVQLHFYCCDMSKCLLRKRNLSVRCRYWAPCLPAPNHSCGSPNRKKLKQITVSDSHSGFLLSSYQICLSSACCHPLLSAWARDSDLRAAQAERNALQVQVWGSLSRKHPGREELWQQQDVPQPAGSTPILLCNLCICA